MPAGSALLVEFDAASQWYNASITIAAGWLKTGGRVSYNVESQPPDNIRRQLKRLGLDTDKLEKEEEGIERTEKLRIWDWYAIQLGQKSKEKLAADSLKAADMSIQYSKVEMRRPPAPDRLVINDNASAIARFNDEKSWVELSLTRGGLAYARLRQITVIHSIMRGVHSEWAYKTLEGAAEGVIDFKLDETADPPRNLMRIRSMRNIGFDGRWRTLKVAENFEITLEN